MAFSRDVGSSPTSLDFRSGVEAPVMSPATDPSRDLLFGLLALQNGLINQAQLVAAFQAWTLDRSRSLADHLIAMGHLDAADRAGTEAMVALHLKRHGGDAEKCLAALRIGGPVRERLASLAAPDIEALIANIGSGT